MTKKMVVGYLDFVVQDQESHLSQDLSVMKVKNAGKNLTAIFALHMTAKQPIKCRLKKRPNLKRVQRMARVKI